MARCSHEGEFSIDVAYARAYGWGGYQDYDEFSGIEVICSECHRVIEEYGTCELEELVREQVNRERGVK